MIYQIRIIPVVRPLNGFTGWTLQAETLINEESNLVLHWSFNRVYEASTEGLDQARATVLHTAKQGRRGVRRSTGWDTDFKRHPADPKWRSREFWDWVERHT